MGTGLASLILSFSALAHACGKAYSLLTLNTMELVGSVRKAVLGVGLAALATGCGVISFQPDTQFDPGPPDTGMEPDVGPPDTGVPDVPEPDTGQPDVGPLECIPLDFPPTTQLPQEWPFGSSQAEWEQVVFTWASAPPTPEEDRNTCTLSNCHGGDGSPSLAKPPFLGEVPTSYGEAIQALWPYLRDEGAYEGSQYTGALWKHHDNYVGDRGEAENPTFEPGETQFLKDLLQMAWSCGAAPILESQQSEPGCGPPEPPPPPPDAGFDDMGEPIDAGDEPDAGTGPDNLCYCELPEGVGPLNTTFCP